MPDDTPQAHEDLYTELMEGANERGLFVVETEEELPDMEFEVEPADKPTRNKLRRSMPDGLLNGIEMPDDVDDIEEVSADDVDLSDVSIKDLTFDAEATERWLDAIVDHFHHEYYSDSEVKNIFNTLEDDYFITAGTYLMELGESSGPVTGFRKE